MGESTDLVERVIERLACQRDNSKRGRKLIHIDYHQRAIFSFDQFKLQLPERPKRSQTYIASESSRF